MGFLKKLFDSKEKQETREKQKHQPVSEKHSVKEMEDRQEKHDGSYDTEWTVVDMQLNDTSIDAEIQEHHFPGKGVKYTARFKVWMLCEDTLQFLGYLATYIHFTDYRMVKHRSSVTLHELHRQGHGYKSFCDDYSGSGYWSSCTFDCETIPNKYIVTEIKCGFAGHFKSTIEAHCNSMDGLKEFAKAIEKARSDARAALNSKADETTTESADTKAEPYMLIKGTQAYIHFKSNRLMQSFDATKLSKEKKPYDYALKAPGWRRNWPDDVYLNYRHLMIDLENTDDKKGIDVIKKIIQKMKEEIHQCIDIEVELSEEEYCNLAAWIALRMGKSIGCSGYVARNYYHVMETIECINCLLFAKIFGEPKGYPTPTAFLVKAEDVRKNDLLWLREVQIILKKNLMIFVLLDRDMITIPDNMSEDESCVFALWDAINDQCYAGIRKEKITEEIEDGYPLEVLGYEERLEPVEMTSDLITRLKQFESVSEETMRIFCEAQSYVI